eukprot:m.24050 g.24050  ORF g.24050 m.24050 type:complete len:674 (+) comp6021_c0_seq1:231-2252(+)
MDCRCPSPKATLTWSTVLFGVVIVWISSSAPTTQRTAIQVAVRSQCTQTTRNRAPKNVSAPYSENLRCTPTKNRELSNCAIDPDVGVPQVIFVYWSQGWVGAPELSQLVGLSWERHNPDWTVVRLSDETLEQWLDVQAIPAFLPGKNVSFQARSDIVRVHLLARYGGIWADSTVFCLGPLRAWLHVAEVDGLFTFRYPRMPVLLASWFLAAVPNSILMLKWRAAIDNYWTKRDSAHTYFWVHALFGDMYKYDREVKQVFGPPDGEADLRNGRARAKYPTCATKRRPTNMSFIVKCSTQRCKYRCKPIIGDMKKWVNQSSGVPVPSFPKVIPDQEVPNELCDALTGPSPQCEADTTEIVTLIKRKIRTRVVNVSSHGVQPLISALCISYGRPEMLRRSVRLWAAQTHPRLELIIVHDAWDTETEAVSKEAAAQFPVLATKGEFLRQVSVVVNTNRSAKLGSLRNSAVASARGQYVIQWDDDDIHLPHRVAHTYASLRCAGKKAIMLDSWLMIHNQAKSGTTKKGRFYVAPSGLQPGSILAERDLLVGCYPDITRSTSDGEVGEDTICTDKIAAIDQIAVLHAPYLYLYINHGANTCSYKHFKWLAQRSAREKNLRFTDEERLAMEGLIAGITGRHKTDAQISEGIAALARSVTKSRFLAACVLERSNHSILKVS